jgi:UDPglucose 6-dehydrogenase
MNPDLDLVYCDTLVHLATNSDALVLVTEWEEFIRTDWKALAKVMRYPLIIDGRNTLLEADVTGADLLYRGIGH